MGYDTERFVEPVDEEFKCSICEDVLQDPLQTPCDHYFCSTCLYPWLDKQRCCPIDRKHVDRPHLKPAPRGLRNLINKLVIACDVDGCNDVMPLADLAAHVSRCQENLNQPVRCQHGCGLTIRLIDVKRHNCIHSMRDYIESQNQRILELIQEKQSILEDAELRFRGQLEEKNRHQVEMNRLLNDTSKQYQDEKNRLLGEARKSHQEEKNRLAEEVRKKNQLIKSLEDKIRSLKGDVRAKESLVKSLEDKCLQLEMSVELNEDTMQTLRKENTAHAEVVQSYEKKVGKLEDDKAHLAHKLDDKITEIKELINRMDIIQVTFSQLQKNMREQEERHKEVNSLAAQLTSEKDDKHQKVTNVRHTPSRPLNSKETPTEVESIQTPTEEATKQTPIEEATKQTESDTVTKQTAINITSKETTKGAVSKQTPAKVAKPMKTDKKKVTKLEATAVSNAKPTETTTRAAKPTSFKMPGLTAVVESDLSKRLTSSDYLWDNDGISLEYFPAFSTPPISEDMWSSEISVRAFPDGGQLRTYSHNWCFLLQVDSVRNSTVGSDRFDISGWDLSGKRVTITCASGSLPVRVADLQSMTGKTVFDISAGEIGQLNLPMNSVLEALFCLLNPVCWNCLHEPKKLKMCSKCKLAKYCDFRCQKEHWEESHQSCCQHLYQLEKLAMVNFKDAPQYNNRSYRSYSGVS